MDDELRKANTEYAEAIRARMEAEERFRISRNVDTSDFLKEAIYRENRAINKLTELSPKPLASNEGL